MRSSRYESREEVIVGRKRKEVSVAGDLFVDSA